MLHGIDISRYQHKINLDKVAADFVIIKASEGIGFKDKMFDTHLSNIKRLNKRFGFYHFARPRNNAVAEAEYFVKVVKDHLNGAVLVLDWEAEDQWNVDWCLTWLNKVYELTGKRALIYMSESVVRKYNWSSVAANYGLWVAKYRDYTPDYNYDMSKAGVEPRLKHWDKAIMWQWTSSGRLDGYDGNLDCNIFYGNDADWNKIANITLPQNENLSTPEEEKSQGKPQEKPQSQEQLKPQEPTIETMMFRCIKGSTNKGYPVRDTAPNGKIVRYIQVGELVKVIDIQNKGKNIFTFAKEPWCQLTDGNWFSFDKNYFN